MIQIKDGANKNDLLVVSEINDLLPGDTVLPEIINVPININ